MKLFSAVLLCAINLAASAPLLDGEGDTSYDTANPTNVTGLDKRTMKTSNCGLSGVYPDIVERGALEGLFALGGSDHSGPNIPRHIIATPGKCQNLFCDYNTIFRLCADHTKSGHNLYYRRNDLGDKINGAFNDCYNRGPYSEEDMTLPALQYWGDGYNIVLRGTEKGDKCKGDD